MSIEDINEAAVEPGMAGVPVRGRPNAVRSKRAKSEATRARLCWATAKLIEQKSIRTLKVSEITNLASVSPSTFYIYFADVDEAILAVLEQARAEMPDLPGLIRAIRLDRLETGVRNFIVAYLGFWDAHFAVLRIRNLAADEGEGTFREARAKMLGPMLDALAEKIVEFRGDVLDHRRAPPPLALSAVLSGSLERLAAYARFRPARPELARRWLIDAAVLLISEVLRPRDGGKDG